MVRDWCQYKGEGVSEDEDEGGEDLVSLLLVFNLDHCVDLIASHLDVFSLGAAAGVCASWRSYFQRLVSPSLTCRVWRSPVPSPTFLHCRDTVQCLAVQSPLLVCGLHNGEVQLWSLLTNSLISVVADHTTPVTAVAISSFPALVLSASWRGELKLYNIKLRCSLPPMRLTHRLVRAISVSGSIAAIGCVEPASGRGEVVLIELGPKGGNVRRNITIEDGGLDCLHLSPSKLVVGGSLEGGGWLTTWRVLARSQYSRSIFLSEDGRKMGRWRCPARVTALLLCNSWQEADAEKEEEQLLLAGDVQGRVWQYGRDGASPLPSSLSCPVTSLRLHSGVLLVSGYSGCLAWTANELKNDSRIQPELLGKVMYSVPATASLHVATCLVTSCGDGRILLYNFARGHSGFKTREEEKEGYQGEKEREDELTGCSLCGSGTNSPEHFFLECPALARPRTAMLQGLDKAVPGVRWERRERQMEVILYGVEETTAALAIRDAVEAFVIRARS